jgi:tetratricopeptide (TPR) repeat protein
MPTLRLTQTEFGNSQQVHLALDRDRNGRPRTATVPFAFELGELDREELRWYLEDYLECPIHPAPVIAGRIEQRLAELGRDLFTGVFATRDAQDLWAQVHDRLPTTRVEVTGEVEAAWLPWELLRDPKTDTPVALAVDTFVRAEHQTATHPALPHPVGGDRLRVLLVICRPGGAADVPFRSIASHLVRLSAQAREAFQLDVLRPPTFRQLGKVLREAADYGQPYLVVHFDGHGTWADLSARGDGVVSLSPLRYPLVSPMRPGAHGYLLFEDPATKDNQRLVDGPALGRLLVETGVGVLVLNACRSAHADLAPIPQPMARVTDAHARIRAYGSLAQEAVDAGVAGVAAMRYSVYVVTAAQFVADLYASLLAGLPLGTAVTRGRKQLAEQPDREIAFVPRPLQDWLVPVVFEATPIALLPSLKAGARQRLEITLDQARVGGDHAAPDEGLPATPAVGFVGRDETLLALDRAFDEHRVVLLHALAGAGKTSTAVEFARWYAHTGGLQGTGRVLFTSFERHMPLARVLDQLGEHFQPALARSGVEWLTLPDTRRREIAVEILQQVPLLWIWDNVEPVAGFPEGTPSAWSVEEQAELAGFLRQVQATKAKVLLTSRRDERAWLGDLPARVGLPPMPMADRVQLARAIATRAGHRLAEVEDWRPLLEYAAGNPLTVTVLVSQALRDRLHTKEQVEALVARLREGEQPLADDVAQGRSRSLGASLAYGFQAAFTDSERAVLALLHLFQGVVNVNALRAMGDPKVVKESAVPALVGWSQKDLIGVLDRAANIGLLTRVGDLCAIHPALPWFLAELFTHHYGPPDTTRAHAARHAYSTAITGLSNYFQSEYHEGRTQVTNALNVEEANLLRAFALARTNNWWDLLISLLQGLRMLYERTGRWVALSRLVNDLAFNELVDPATNCPYAGREHHWRVLTDCRVLLAEQARDWATAGQLQQALVAWERERAAGALATDPATLTSEQRRTLRSLSTALLELGDLLSAQRQPACVPPYDEALEVAQRIADRQGEAIAAYNLGHAYLDIPGLHDLEKAERWLQHGLGLFNQNDQRGRAAAIKALGAVYLQRFLEARAARRSEPELLAQLNAALDASQQALALTPPDALDHLANAHNQLGIIYAEVGNVDKAMTCWRKTIRYHEDTGDRYNAAQVRYNAALVLLRYNQRLEEALLWAQAAIEDYQPYGQAVAIELTKTQQLIVDIQQAISGGQPQ